MRNFTGIVENNDIVLFNDGCMCFGDELIDSDYIHIKGVISIDDAEYWDYFFDCEE